MDRLSPALGAAVDLELDVVGVAQDDQWLAKGGRGRRGMRRPGGRQPLLPVAELGGWDGEGQMVEPGAHLVELAAVTVAMVHQSQEGAAGEEIGRASCRERG